MTALAANQVLKKTCLPVVFINLFCVHYRENE